MSEIVYSENRGWASGVFSIIECDDGGYMVTQDRGCSTAGSFTPTLERAFDLLDRWTVPHLSPGSNLDRQRIDFVYNNAGRVLVTSV